MGQRGRDRRRQLVNGVIGTQKAGHMEQQAAERFGGRVCGTCQHWRKVTAPKGACTQPRAEIRTVKARLHFCYPVTDSAGTCEHWTADTRPRLVLTVARRLQSV